MKQSPKPGLEEVVAKAEAETPCVVFNHRSIPELWNSRIDWVIVFLPISPPLLLLFLFLFSLNHSSNSQVYYDLPHRCLYQLQRTFLVLQDFLHYRIPLHHSSRYDLPYRGGRALE